MADATYRDSVMGQIDGNVFISVDMKAGIIDILNRFFTESQIKHMSTADKKRFFYKNNQTDVSKKIMDELSPSAKRTIQNQVNRLARQGRQSENVFIADNFSATYTRGGHKYVNGKRIY